MHRSPLSICSRCRHDLLSLHFTEKRVLTRARSGGSAKTSPKSHPHVKPPSRPAKASPRPLPHAKPPSSRPSKFAHPAPRPQLRHARLPQEGEERPSFILSPNNVPKYLAEHVSRWKKDGNVSKRLRSFGVDQDDVKPLLNVFAGVVSERQLLSALDVSQEQLARLAHDLSHSKGMNVLDMYLTKMLFEWVSSPIGESTVKDCVSATTISKMAQLFLAADLSNPTSWYSETRANPPRKIIMHVGPTNSGKTHNALRALAAARTGVYAGPLRLLAHEIWERLNKGQIVPLGMEPEPDAKPDFTSNIDASGATPVIIKDENRRYARWCNMLTGEEQKIVSEHDALVSCTVEMTPLQTEYDVAVVDEIQMIADGARGGAWTAAVLGLKARELHLCGEETAVPLVEAMLRDTGDELIVNRYKRLTPLRLADESLNGDLSEVQKGDCLVTFSRKQLFNAKRQIEQVTGLRCAVAYGRLPPEIRSEQAALFNRPDSGYDVLVGSDAIGLGLNLKIKRIIFETVRKFNGLREIILSTSQIKQIAGRAGRFGLHGQDESGGIVTTLMQADLPIVDKALKAPISPLRHAFISFADETFGSILHALPPDAPSMMALDVYQYVAKMHPLYRFQDIEDLKNRMDFVDVLAGDLPISDRVVILSAPTPYRDVIAMETVRVMVRQYSQWMRVGLREALEISGVLRQYEDIIRKTDGSLENEAQAGKMLNVLESVHKVIVLYLWFSYRHPVAYPDQKEAFRMREEAEHAMEKCLRAVTAKMNTLDTVPRSRSSDIQYKTQRDLQVSRQRIRNRKELQEGRLAATLGVGAADVSPQ